MTQETALLCSVIVPVYNGQATITGCLEALARQQMAEAGADSFEVIVVDDGSTDGTKEIVEGWMARQSTGRWRLLSQPNAGPAAARNCGAEAAKGAILLFTDADCIPSPTWVAEMTAPFRQQPAPAAVMGRYLSGQGEPAARFAQYEFEERYALMSRQAQIDLVATYAAAYQRAIFLAAGGFDTSFPKANNEDVDFSFRLSKAGERMIFAPQATVSHPHTATWWRYFTTKRERAYWRMQVYRRYPEKAVADTYTPQSLKVQLLLGAPALAGLSAALVSGGWYWLLPLLLFGGAALPTVGFMARRDPAFVLWAFWGVWLRSLAFAIGVAWGLLRPYSGLAAHNPRGAAAAASYE